MNYKEKAIYRIPFDLSEPPQKHFQNELYNKMLNMYVSDDDSYILVVYRDETECILLTNNEETSKKDNDKEY